MAVLPVLGASRLEALFEDSARTVLETAALPSFLMNQRWFGGKARGVARVRLADGGPLQPPLTLFLAVADVEFADGGMERYALPLTVLAPEHSGELLSHRPASAVAWIDGEGSLLLVDALSDDDACRGLLAAIGARTRFVLVTGSVSTERDAATVVQQPLGQMAVRRSGAEQSNSSVIFDRASILKVYRRLEPGPHPELELGRFLRQAGFTDVPAVLGSIEYTSGVSSCALAVLHALVPDAIDGWEHALEHAGHYFVRVAAMPVHQARAWMPSQAAHLGHSERCEPAAREVFGAYLDAARTLGQQTAALHLTLARGIGEGLAPEPMSAADVAALIESTRTRARSALTLLTERLPPSGAAAERARALIAAQPRLLERCDSLAGMQLDVVKTRCHQDYHLGQLLWTGARYALLDFEGEPARPLAERRRKRAPLTDVAGMLRSYSYAAWSGLFAWSRAHRADALEREPWATLWETAVSNAFLTAYLDATRGAAFIPPDARQLRALLELLMIDKALYELDYELNNRPDWLPVPIEGLLRLLR